MNGRERAQWGRAGTALLLWQERRGPGAVLQLQQGPWSVFPGRRVGDSRLQMQTVKLMFFHLPHPH